MAVFVIFFIGERVESNAFGSMTSPLVVNNVQCSGTENRLDSCPNLRTGCMMQAGLQCYTSKHSNSMSKKQM